MNLQLYQGNRSTKQAKQNIIEPFPLKIMSKNTRNKPINPDPGLAYDLNQRTLFNSESKMETNLDWSQGGNCMPWLEALHNVHCLDSGHIHNINCMYIFFSTAAHSSVYAVVEVHIIHVLWVQAYVESAVLWRTTVWVWEQRRMQDSAELPFIRHCELEWWPERGLGSTGNGCWLPGYCLPLPPEKNWCMPSLKEEFEVCFFKYCQRKQQEMMIGRREWNQWIISFNLSLILWSLNSKDVWLDFSWELNGFYFVEKWAK